MIRANHHILTLNGQNRKSTSQNGRKWRRKIFGWTCIVPNFFKKKKTSLFGIFHTKLCGRQIEQTYFSLTVRRANYHRLLVDVIGCVIFLLVRAVVLKLCWTSEATKNVTRQETKYLWPVLLEKEKFFLIMLREKMIGTRFIVQFALLINSMHKEDLDTSLVRHVKLSNHVVGH